MLCTVAACSLTHKHGYMYIYLSRFRFPCMSVRARQCSRQQAASKRPTHPSPCPAQTNSYQKTVESALYPSHPTHTSKSEKQSNVPNHYLSPSASDVRFTVLQLTTLHGIDGHAYRVWLDGIVLNVTRSGAGICGTVDVVFNGVWACVQTHTHGDVAMER